MIKKPENSINLKPFNMEFEPCPDSNYIKLHRVSYEQDGRRKSWDFIKVHDSVAVLLADKEREELILVRQFRPPVYMREGTGITYELCAGITDKELPLEEIAREEILEETGYNVETEDIHKINSFYTAVSFAGSRQTLFYAEVNDNLLQGEGGGIGNEKIEVIRLPFSEIENFMFDETKPKTPGLLFALIWFKRQRDTGRK
ncbi:NUDIX domain-containing protein [Limisalsivibrio acetivorans]|uniref:NUDIX domain-containing protein n=1 Tax=Limisalsivibrio acetivorans TaxID=1304888 RepID=UPI0003B3B8DC|nr:NUDIX domain-containing protein [Limisalsivibrio acetivorans]